MRKLETVVRPFQGGDVFTARVLPPMQPPVATPPPILTGWGREISLQATAIGLSDYRVGVVDNEIDRVTRTVRITNPDDPEQYVDVERIEQLRVKDEIGVIKTLNLNNP